MLDTHAWVWWLSDPSKLPGVARRAVAKAAADRAIYISAISTWEIVLLVSKNRLQFTMDAQDWIARSEALPFFHFVPVDNAIAIIQQSGIKYEVGPFATVLEGKYDEVMKVISDGSKASIEER